MNMPMALSRAPSAVAIAAALLFVAMAAASARGRPGPAAPAPQAARRLTVAGSKLYDPDGQPIRLTGFNWQIGRTVPGEGRVMRAHAPGANVARLVGVLWDNSDPASGHPSADCMTQRPPHYFDDGCFKQLDAWVQDATDAGLWVILAVRAMVGAGQHYDTDPASDVFHNATLRGMLYAMWTHVAGHYASFDNIAAYEIMSEPRDKAIDVATVREFYAGGCAAAQAADPATPCMVGGAPYYNIYTFGDGLVLANNTNVIYTFDYFDPSPFVFGQSDIPTYNATYECKKLAKGWVAQGCPGGKGEALVKFDRDWHADNFEKFVAPVRAKHNVPLFMNQWEVVHGVTKGSGRYDYIRDVADLAEELDIGWAWWTWAGGNDVGWSHGSAEMIFRFPNGTVVVDQAALDTMAPYMAGRNQSNQSTAVCADTAAGTCTVCPKCCHSYIPAGRACASCVAESCPPRRTGGGGGGGGARARARGAASTPPCANSGVRAAGGGCVCDPPFKAPDCVALDIAAVAAGGSPDALVPRFGGGTGPARQMTWGGSPVQDPADGRYHLFFSWFKASDNATVPSIKWWYVQQKGKGATSYN